MATYQYVALNDKGREKRGVIEGDTPRHIRKQLRDLGLSPVSVISAVTQKKTALDTGLYLRSDYQVNITELALITRQLATLIQAGLPLDEALSAVSQQCDKEQLTGMVLSIRTGVLEGKTLAESFADYPRAFDTLYCSMVAAGEDSGNLGQVLIKLSDHIEQRQALRQQTKLALLYPAILTGVAILIIAGLLAFVVPRVVEQFSTAGQVLPLATRILIVVSDAVKDYWWVALLTLFLFSYALKWRLKNTEFRYRFDKNILALPVIGKVVRNVNTSRFSDTLSVLISSGIPLIDALAIAGRVLNNVCLQQAISVAATHLREGSSLHRALMETGYFPPMMLHMIANGEKSGKLDEMLTHIASNQEREHKTMIAMVLGLFEPLLILLMGGVVLFIVMAILLPIFELNSLVG